MENLAEIDELLDELTPAAEQVLASASALFYRDGIHAVGVDTIADESGVTKRTLYNNFGSKDTLVAAYLKKRHRDFWQRLEKHLADAEKPRCLAFFDVYAEDTEHAVHGCAFLNAAAELPYDHLGYAVIRYHKRAIEEQLRGLIAEDHPAVADPQRLARHVFLVLEGGFAHHGMHGKALLAEARDIVADLLEGR